MGPPMHSPLSSSEDDLNLSQNDDNVADDNDEECGVESSQGHSSRRHGSRRHKGVHKDRKRRHHKRKGHSSSQSEHSSRRRKHRSHHNDDKYDFEPKPQIMSSKPLVQYDDVSENDDIISNEVILR